MIISIVNNNFKYSELCDLRSIECQLYYLDRSYELIDYYYNGNKFFSTLFIKIDNEIEFQRQRLKYFQLC
jgi:hypothetical protein